MLEIRSMTVFDMETEMGLRVAENAAVDAAVQDALKGFIQRFSDGDVDKLRDRVWQRVLKAGLAGRLTTRINRKDACVYLLVSEGQRRGRTAKGDSNE